TAVKAPGDLSGAVRCRIHFSSPAVWCPSVRETVIGLSVRNEYVELVKCYVVKDEQYSDWLPGPRGGELPRENYSSVPGQFTLRRADFLALMFSRVLRRRASADLLGRDFLRGLGGLATASSMPFRRSITASRLACCERD